MADDAEGIIAVDDVSKQYNQTVGALREVTFSVRQGEFLTIVGRSGSGKSTLLYIIGGLDYPTSGQVRVSGIPTNYHDRSALIRLRREQVGFVFQQFNLLPAMTAADNVAYPLLFHRRPRPERQARARELLGLVGLADRAGHYPSELSGGEQQRVAIARALANRPKLILADEPTASLDTIRGKKVMDLLKRIARENQTAVITVTHDARMIEGFDHVYHLKDGRLQEH